MPRFAAIDALRGGAVALMVAYHFCFDLGYYGWIQAALASVSSYALFPRSWIFFGVLHFVAVASVLGFPALAKA